MTAAARRALRANCRLSDFWLEGGKSRCSCGNGCIVPAERYVVRESLTCPSLFFIEDTALPSVHRLLPMETRNRALAEFVARELNAKGAG